MAENKNCKIAFRVDSNRKHVCSICEPRNGATMKLYERQMLTRRRWERIFCALDALNSIIDFEIHTFFSSSADWSSSEHGPVHRQLSVSSDSKLLDDDIREETRVIMRQKKPPRPKSEVFLNKHESCPRRKRFSAFGVSWVEHFPAFNRQTFA